MEVDKEVNEEVDLDQWTWTSKKKFRESSKCLEKKQQLGKIFTVEIHS